MKDLLLEDQIASSDTYRVKNTFVRPAQRIAAVLYEPVETSCLSDFAVLVMHSDSDYLSFSAGEELAGRGFRVLCANVSNSQSNLDSKIENVASCIKYLKTSCNVRHIALIGHSGGGTLMSAYQSIAENGPSIYQKDTYMKKCPDSLSGLDPADALILLDSNWGNGAMRLFSLDPAVTDETDSHKIDPALDLFNPANGFKKGGSTYNEEFVKNFFKGQHERNSRLNEYVAKRLKALDEGCASYDDDEPLIIPGTEQGFFNNKLYAQDIRFMSCTREPHTLLSGDGSRTSEIVHSLRGAENDVSFTASYNEGALHTTVKNYLSSFAIRTTPDYGFDESNVWGIDWDSNYNCTTGNIRFVSAPLLVMGMTAGWEAASAETIWENAAGADKTLAYVKGANHLFRPASNLEKYPGEFGDTVKVTYDFVSAWIMERFS